MESKSQGRRQ
ncbi:hypothetical protein LINGRAHAP2_LOCUS1762 [Linum grandiflorum]